MRQQNSPPHIPGGYFLLFLVLGMKPRDWHTLVCALSGTTDLEFCCFKFHCGAVMGATAAAKVS
jgi:hypothetical protein